MQQSNDVKNLSQAFWDDFKAKLAFDTDGIKSLLKNRTVTVHDRDPQYGATLLIQAVSRANYEIAQLCINMGADMSAVDRMQNMTAYDHAADVGRRDLEQLLLLSEHKGNTAQLEHISSALNRHSGVTQSVLEALQQYDVTTREFFKDTLCDVMAKLIASKKSFSDDMLQLCWCIEAQNGDPLHSTLWQTIIQTCEQILASQDQTDWFWFKNCLLPSNIWFLRNDNGQFLYIELLQLAQKQADILLNNLQNDIDQEANAAKQAWDRLCTMQMSNEQLGKWRQATATPRQDSIPQGITATRTKEHLDTSATTAAFDGARFYDYHLYLSLLLLLAQTVDDSFQKAVQNVFNINQRTQLGCIDNNEEKGDSDVVAFVEYHRGPVKLLERARDKAANDYAGEAFPTSACVIDLNRCLLIFEDLPALLAGVDLFVKKVKANKSGCIVGIARMKNGFTQYAKDGPQYADLKLNVVIQGTTHNIIGEVQFLLRTMKNFKNVAHNLYGIEREKEFVSGAQQVIPVLTDLERQMQVCASLGDTNGMMRAMLNSNKPLKHFLMVDSTKNLSLLYSICLNGHVKALSFAQSLLSTEEFMSHLFMSRTIPLNNLQHETTPIESACGKGKEKLLRYVLRIKEVREAFVREKKWKFRAFYQTFVLNTDPDSVDVILSELGLDDNALLELVEYQYEDQQSYFRQRPLVSEMILNNNLSVVRKLLDKMSGLQRAKHATMLTDNYGQTAVERALQSNKSNIVDYLFSFTAQTNH